MADILIVGDAVFPVADGEAAVCVAALARALQSTKHKVSILTLADEGRAVQLPGMARRLRTVLARLADGDKECGLYEGRSAASQCALHVLGAKSLDRGHSAAFLASAAAALVRDEICRPDAIIAWGEAAAAVLPAIAATARIFVLPTGAWGPPLSPQERAALDPNAPDLAMAAGSLAGLGAIDADVVVFPSPSSAMSFVAERAFSFRASDQPVLAIRLGCDESPYDPSTDPALAANFSAQAPAGKAECRRALLRRTSLAVGPRTLLLATAPLTSSDVGRQILDAIPSLVRSDVAVVVPAVGERALIDEIRRIAIETPGKLAVYPDTEATAERQILAGADAVLFADLDNHLARSAGLAARYGALPLAPDTAAYRDFVVDVDVASRTGDGLLYQPGDAYELVSTVLRAATLRGDSEVWQPLQNRLLAVAPHWENTAAQFETLCLSPPASA